MGPKGDIRVEYDEVEAPPPSPLTMDRLGVTGELRALRERGRAQDAALARGRRRGVRRPRYAFGLGDLAAACGCSARTLQRWRVAGRFDPRDFGSVAALIRARASWVPRAVPSSLVGLDQLFRPGG